MDVQKIKTDADFSESVVEPGQILVFSALENGKPVTRYKDSSGNFGTLSGGGGGGGGGGADVTLGQIDADGNFQPLAFDGQTASNDGDPEAVESYYGWNGVLPVPDKGIKVGEAAEYYKCASVDTANKTWTGYLAVLTDGVYTFEETATTGLTYGAAYTPKQDGIYNVDATVQITKLWQGSTIDIGLVFDLPMTEKVSTALTGQVLTFGSDVTLKTYKGKACWYSYGGSWLTFPADDLSVEDYTIAISMARTYTKEYQTAIGYGDRGDRTTALIGTMSGNIFFGGYNLEIQGSSLTEGEWYHGVVVKSGTLLTIYCNGVVDTTGVVTKSLVQGIGYIGRNSDSDESYNESWHGYLADAKIWNRALTADEVLEVYNAANIPTA